MLGTREFCGEHLMKRLEYDKVGYWSEIKLDIIKEYAATYTRIMSAQRNPSFTFIYIDAFAGPGQHVSRRTGEFIPGSPLNALNIKNPFNEYHFIDLNEQKVAELENLAGERGDVFVYHGDCNEILPTDILPRAQYDKYCRALCILDPYGLHLNWANIKMAGRMKSVEIFLNFPIMDINMNVLKHDKSKVDKKQLERMNAFWGDDSWKKVAYVQSKQKSLFGDAELEKTSNKKIVEAFRQRLKKVAGFNHVPQPIAMRNTQNAIIYYLFFASNKPVAQEIVQNIFDKYANRKV